MNVIQTASRREFLAASAGLAAAAALPAVAQDKKEPLFKISLAEWSLHRALQSKQLDTVLAHTLPGADIKRAIDSEELVNA